MINPFENQKNTSTWIAFGIYIKVCFWNDKTGYMAYIDTTRPHFVQHNLPSINLMTMITPVVDI